MRHPPLYLISLWLMPFSASFALSITDSPIRHVTLYPTSAKIERSISVKAGQQIVTLEGLTANFDINQLQYQTSNIDVNAVSHTDSALDKPAGQESKQLIMKIDEIKLKISEQNAIIQAAELQNKFLGNITKGSSNKVRRQAYDAFVAIDQAKLEKTRLEQALAESEQDLNSIGDHQFNQRSLKFYVNAPKNGEIKMSYMVSYARWQPIYKAELNTQTKQLKLTRMAMIAQKTGEDWNNVQLSLSTVSPQNTLAEINPTPWWVNYNAPRTHDRVHAPVVEVAPLDYEEMAEKKSQNANRVAPQFPQFQADTLNFSTEYKANTQASISSSRQQIYLPLSAEEYPAKLSIWVIPRQSNDAILNAEINTLDSNWPSGQVKLYRDGDYMGQRQWINSAEHTAQMNFGRDDQIQVKVTDLVDRKNSIKSSNQSETKQKQQYSVENRHNYPIQIKLFDAEPQSQNSKLTAKTTYSLAPMQREWQGQPYINQWDVQLAPKQKFELNLEREFRYPNSGNTSGF